MSSEGGFEPEIVALYCQHCLAEGVEIPESYGERGFTCRLVVMPCSSRMETSQLLKLLERGADGVELVGCPEEQCRFLEGSLRAEKRVEWLKKLLVSAGISAERLHLDYARNLSGEELIALVRERAGVVGKVGRNPLREERS